MNKNINFNLNSVLLIILIILVSVILFSSDMDDPKDDSNRRDVVMSFTEDDLRNVEIQEPTSVVNLGACNIPDQNFCEYRVEGESVFYLDTKIIEADPITFTPIKTGSYRYDYARDANSIYWKSYKIVGADLDTFHVFDGQQTYEGCGMGPYSFDVNHVYYKNLIVEGADPETFIPILGSDSFGEDSKNFYKREKISDPSTYEECNYG